MNRSILLFIPVVIAMTWQPVSAQDHLGQWYGSSNVGDSLYAVFATDSVELWLFDADSMCYNMSQWGYTVGNPNFTLTGSAEDETEGFIFQIGVVVSAAGMTLTLPDDEGGGTLIFNLLPNGDPLEDVPDCTSSDGDGGEDGDGNPCPSDLDDDDLVTVNDMLLLLADFGCSSNCSADVNEDGSVTVADMLALLSEFGQSCA